MMGGGKGGWGGVAAAQRRRRGRENDGMGAGWERGEHKTKMSGVDPCNSGGGDALTLLRACVARSCVLASGG